MVDAKITLEYKDFKELEGEATRYKKEYNKILDFLKSNVKITDGKCLFEGKDAPCEEEENEKNMPCIECKHYKPIEFEITDNKKFGEFLAELILDV